MANHPRRSSKTSTEALFVIRLLPGFSDKKSLPVDYVIRALQEVKAMLELAGRRIEREHGFDKAKGDLGLELVAGFQAGSVQTALRTTKSQEIFVEAAEDVVQTIQSLGLEPRAEPIAARPVDLDPRIIRRLNNIGKIQAINRTRMELILKVGSQRSRGMFDEAAAKKAASFRDPNFALEEVVLFGKLAEIRDKTHEEIDVNTFIGQLLTDEGETWRLEFPIRDASKAASLFRQQIFVSGRALHYRAASPKIEVHSFGLDEDRDYEAAFDKLYGSKRSLYNADLKTLLDELRGDK